MQHPLIVKFTQKRSCHDYWLSVRLMGRGRDLPLCNGSARGLNCIMTVLHGDFIKAIHSLVFRFCGVSGSAKVLRDMPFKPEFPSELLVMPKGQLASI